LPKGKAIDSFIGLSSMIGRRHGEAYLHLPAELLCAKGAPRRHRSAHRQSSRPARL
jgi:hypothetical protein